MFRFVGNVDRYNDLLFEVFALLGCYVANSGNTLPTFRYKLSAPNSRFRQSRHLKMGPMVCPKTSVRNYHYSLRNSPEERSSALLRGRSLKSRVASKLFYFTTWMSIFCVLHFVYSIWNSFNSYDRIVAVYTGLGLGLVKQVVSGFGLASDGTGQLYIKHSTFSDNSPHPGREEYFVVAFILCSWQKTNKQPKELWCRFAVGLHGGLMSLRIYWKN